MGTLTVTYNNTNIVNGVSQSAPPNITYNNATIVTGLTGTKTLTCADKMMKTNVVIGTKTLTCADKVAKTNIVATYTVSAPAKVASVTALTTARSSIIGASVGNYALMAGGIVSSSMTQTTEVNAYNTSLTKSTPTALSAGMDNAGGDSACPGPGTSIGSNYAIFTYLNSVSAYNASLSRSTPTNLPKSIVYNTATKVGDYGLIGGGYERISSSSYQATTNVSAYNTSLTLSTATALSVARFLLAAATVGNYALFGGGEAVVSGSYQSYSTMDAYNTSLTRSTPTALSAMAYCLAATTVGNYALFGGGYTSGSTITSVSAYNTSLTRSTPTALSKGRKNISAATAANSYALFAGGSLNGNTRTNIVDGYNTSLTLSTQTNLTYAVANAGAASIGSYAIFGGGDSKTGGQNLNTTVNAYGCT